VIILINGLVKEHYIIRDTTFKRVRYLTHIIFGHSVNCLLLNVKVSILAYYIMTFLCTKIPQGEKSFKVRIPAEGKLRHQFCADKLTQNWSHFDSIRQATSLTLPPILVKRAKMNH